MSGMPDDFNARHGAALDRFDVPAPSADFAARIARAAQQPPIAGSLWRRSDSARRGAWLRRGLIGVAAVGLAGTAAATGFFQELASRVPVLAQLVAPAPVPVVRPPQARKPAQAEVGRPSAPVPASTGSTTGLAAGASPDAGGALPPVASAPVASAGPAPLLPRNAAAAPVQLPRRPIINADARPVARARLDDRLDGRLGQRLVERPAPPVALTTPPAATGADLPPRAQLGEGLRERLADRAPVLARPDPAPVAEAPIEQAAGERAATAARLDRQRMGQALRDLRERRRELRRQRARL